MIDQDRFTWDASDIVRLNPRIAKQYRPETVVHVAADAHEPAIYDVVMQALARAKRAINRPRLRQALATRDMAAAHSAVSAVSGTLRTTLLKMLPPVLQHAAVAGGQAGAQLLTQQLRAAALRTADKDAGGHGSYKRGEQPTQPTGSDEPYGDARFPIEMFHGTTSAALEAIRKEGLVPAKGKGGDASFVDTRTGQTGYTLKHRPLSVYMAEDELNAV